MIVKNGEVTLLNAKQVQKRKKYTNPYSVRKKNIKMTNTE